MGNEEKSEQEYRKKKKKKTHENLIALKIQVKVPVIIKSQKW